MNVPKAVPATIMSSTGPSGCITATGPFVGGARVDEPPPHLPKKLDFVADDVVSTDGVGVTDEEPDVMGVKALEAVLFGDGFNDATEVLRLGEGDAAGVAYASRPSGNTAS